MCERLLCLGPRSLPGQGFCSSHVFSYLLHTCCPFWSGIHACNWWSSPPHGSPVLPRQQAFSSTHFQPQANTVGGPVPVHKAPATLLLWQVAPELSALGWPIPFEYKQVGTCLVTPCWLRCPVCHEC